MWGGKLQFTAPMLFSIGLVTMFTIGGLSGVTHAVAPGRHPADRHLLHRRPLPLRALRWRLLRLHGRLVLLLAEGLRLHAQRDARQGQLLDDAPRLQPDLRPHAHPRPPGHEPPHLHLRRRLRLRLLEQGGHRSAPSSSPAASRCSSSTSSTARRRSKSLPAGRPRPVGRPHPRVDDPLADAGLQLRPDPHRHPRRRLLVPQVRRDEGRRASCASPTPTTSCRSARRQATSTCRRRRTGRSCVAFGLPIVAYGLHLHPLAGAASAASSWSAASTAGSSSRRTTPTPRTATSTHRTTSRRRAASSSPRRRRTRSPTTRRPPPTKEVEPVG